MRLIKYIVLLSVIFVTGCQVPMRTVTSHEIARDLYQKNQIDRVHLVPLEMGGKDVEENYIYLTAGAARHKRRVDQKALQLKSEGKISEYVCDTKYFPGESIVPNYLIIKLTGKETHKFMVPVYVD